MRTKAAALLLALLLPPVPAAARVCGDAVLRRTLAPDMYALGRLLGQRYPYCHAHTPGCGSRALRRILDPGAYARRCGP